MMDFMTLATKLFCCWSYQSDIVEKMAVGPASEVFVVSSTDAIFVSEVINFTLLSETEQEFFGTERWLMRKSKLTQINMKERGKGTK